MLTVLDQSWLARCTFFLANFKRPSRTPFSQIPISASIGYKGMMIMSPYDHIYREQRKLISGTFGKNQVVHLHESLEKFALQLVCSLYDDPENTTEIVRQYVQENHTPTLPSNLHPKGTSEIYFWAWYMAWTRDVNIPSISQQHLNAVWNSPTSLFPASFSSIHCLFVSPLTRSLFVMDHHLHSHLQWDISLLVSL